MSKTSELTKIYKQYEKGRLYLTSKGVYDGCQTFRDFWEGNQWGDHEISTQLDIPEISIPVSQSLVGNKIANTLKDTTSVEFFTDVGDDNGEKDDKLNTLQMFYDWVCQNMDIKSARRAVVTSGAIEMLGILYFYFDTDPLISEDINKGDIRCEEIPIQDFVVENFSVKDIQKQEYVIIRRNISVEKAKSMAKKVNKSSNLNARIEECVENLNDDSKINDEIIPIFIKFWRKDGEVYWQTACKTVNLTEPTPLNVDIEAKRIRKLLDGDEYDNEYETDPARDSVASGGTENLNGDKFYLYPIALFRYKDRKNSIIGLSEMESLVTAQKAINYYTSLVVKNGFDLASPILLLNPNMLNGQSITNAPSQQLFDYSNTNLNGMRYVTTDPALVNNGLAFVSNLNELLRTSNSSTAILSGTMEGRELANSTVNTLLQQAKAPLDDPIHNLRNFDEQCARIISLFAKFYYDNKQFSYRAKAEDYTMDTLTKYGIQLQDNQYQQVNEAIPSDKQFVVFNGSDYRGMNVGVMVKSVQDNDNYATLLMQTIQQFVMNGNFSQLSFDMKLAIIDSLPESVMDYEGKKIFINAIIREQNGVLAQMQNAVSQLQQQLQTMQQQIAQLEDDKTQMTNAFKRELEGQTDLLKQASQVIDNLKKDKAELEEQLAQLVQAIRNEYQKVTSAAQPVV